MSKQEIIYKPYSYCLVYVIFATLMGVGFGVVTLLAWPASVCKTTLLMAAMSVACVIVFTRLIAIVVTFSDQDITVLSGGRKQSISWKNLHYQYNTRSWHGELFWILSERELMIHKLKKLSNSAGWGKLIPHENIIVIPVSKTCDMTRYEKHVQTYLKKNISKKLIV